MSWYCHCCRYKNVVEDKKCHVCGRDESYAMTGYALPLHGQGSKMFRSSQLGTVISEEGLFERDSVQWTALHSAAVNGNTDVILELLRRQCLVDALTDQGQSALHLAVYSGSLDCVKALISNGASVHTATFNERMTPLHLACQRDWKVIAKYLLDSGANVNALNIIERTPLHFAAQTGRTDLAVLLLKAGALPHAMDLQGWTARQVAELHGHRDMQELLVKVNMKEKQVVLKQLPPAPWHGELWDGVVRINKLEKERAVKDIKLMAQLTAQAEALQHNLRHKPEHISRVDSITVAVRLPPPIISLSATAPSSASTTAALTNSRPLPTKKKPSLLSAAADRVLSRK